MNVPSRRGETIQVVAQRGCGDVELALDLSRRGAVDPALDDVAKDGEPDRVPQGAELLCVTVKLGRHTILLRKSKESCKAHFDNSRTTVPST